MISFSYLCWWPFCSILLMISFAKIEKRMFVKHVCCNDFLFLCCCCFVFDLLSWLSSSEFLLSSAMRFVHFITIGSCDVDDDDDCRSSDSKHEDKILNLISHIHWTHYPSMRTKMIEKKSKTQQHTEKKRIFVDHVYMNDNELFRVSPTLWCPECYLVKCAFIWHERERERRKSITYCRSLLCKWKIDEIVIEWSFYLFSHSLSPEWREKERKRKDANRFRSIRSLSLMRWFHLNGWILLLFFFRLLSQSIWKELDIAPGHHVSFLYTHFPDDDYPCCELVTSVIRGRTFR